MAFSAMWIAIASFIYVFDIKKAEDENGKSIELSHDYNSALVVYVFFLLADNASLLMSFYQNAETVHVCGQTSF